MADEDPTPPSTPEEIEAQRRRVFESLPPEIRANPEVRRSFGLGDAVEILAKPIAGVLGIKNCAACAKRKARWNKVKLW